MYWGPCWAPLSLETPIHYLFRLAAWLKVWAPNIWLYFYPDPWADPKSRSPSRPQGSILYTIGVLEPRIGGSTFWILPGVWVGSLAHQVRTAASGFVLQQPWGCGQHRSCSFSFKVASARLMKRKMCFQNIYII